MCRHLPKKEKDLASIWSNGNLVNAEGIKKQDQTHRQTDGDNTGSEDVSVIKVQPSEGRLCGIKEEVTRASGGLVEGDGATGPSR